MAEELDPKMVERVAKAIYDDLCPDARDDCQQVARTAIAALPLSPAALNALWRGEAVVVPKEPTANQWEQLARDIMMWLDMSRHGDDAPTPRSLFKHLERLRRPIPQWLCDEEEMQSLDHVPSKGTRVAIIYKAMLAASPYADKPNDQ